MTEITHPDDARTAEEEHAAVRRVLDATRDDGERRFVVWRPSRQVAFGRRDTTCDGYDDALETAEDAGYATTLRNVGGRAVVHAGETVAFAVTEPTDDPRHGIRDRYDEYVCRTREALETVSDRELRCGEPEGAFCPGDASLSTDDGKVGGIAQRVERDGALVSGVVVVGNRDETARLLSSVYGTLGVRFEPSTVGSLPGIKSRRVADSLRNEFDAP